MNNLDCENKGDDSSLFLFLFMEIYYNEFIEVIGRKSPKNMEKLCISFCSRDLSSLMAVFVVTV